MEHDVGALLPGEMDLRAGRGLVFALGAFRGGTTLLRKVLDTHPAIYSPSETWFLLPLVSLWEGVGTHPKFSPDQSAVAIQYHVDREQFMACCRAFAGRFYAEALARGTTRQATGPTSPTGPLVFVDKTPLYLQLAGALPHLFPEARFIVLGRDPRGILWSRHTWKHASKQPPATLIPGVAGDVQRLAQFAEAFRDRSTLVRYEDLCTDPETTSRRLCSFLGVDFDPAMIAYGDARHQEGYGDEKSRLHNRPHTLSVERWRGEMPAEVQAQLARACGTGPLKTLGYAEVDAPSDARATATGQPVR